MASLIPVTPNKKSYFTRPSATKDADEFKSRKNQVMKYISDRIYTVNFSLYLDMAE